MALITAPATATHHTVRAAKRKPVRPRGAIDSMHSRHSPRYLGFFKTPWLAMRAFAIVPPSFCRLLQGFPVRIFLALDFHDS